MDPLRDGRWAEFLERQEAATVFHSAEWLRALQSTYGYRAQVVTTSCPGERLTDALVFCRVNSWLTGRRMISVPFSDHCTPLVESAEAFGNLLSHLKHALDQGPEHYLEIRSGVGRKAVGNGMDNCATFCLHRLDLRPAISDLFHAFHGNCIRRKIARANREGVTYEEGTSEVLLHKFYQLTVLTRRRQQILPQPLSWFRNLVTCLGNKVTIRVASHHDQPLAAILTIRYKNSMTYKYGCSDRQFHRLGPMQLLMWKAIEEAKNAGLAEFDMGRTDWDNGGLLAFKDRWGCTRSRIVYLRYPPQAENVSFHFPKSIFDFAPTGLLSIAGGLVYRHIG